MTKNASRLDGTALERIVGEMVEEFTQRLRQGEFPDPEEYAERYPQAADIFREVLPGLALITCGFDGPSASDSAGGSQSGPTDGRLGDYRLLREIGRGGMGVVYEAEQVSLHRRVALKVLPFAGALDERQLQRFKNEALAAAQLDHPHIVDVYGVGCERAVHFFVMRYVEGHSLAEVIQALRDERRRGTAAVPSGNGASRHRLASTGVAGAVPRRAVPPGGPMETADVRKREVPTRKEKPSARLSDSGSTEDPAYFLAVAKIGIQLAAALDHAHQSGVVHRDVKPANIILDAHRKAWITDFGLARAESNVNLTMTGDVLGTLRYMSPEQALAKRAVLDHRTDIYSLGATLYELLTLEPAFPETDRQTLLRRIVSEDPVPPRRLSPRLPADLETIVLKALAKNPRERYDTAGDLADDLRRFLGNRPITARRPTLRQRAAKWAQRHTALVWSAAAILLVTTLALGISTAMILSALGRETAALDQARTNLDQTERERAEKERERQRAEENLQLAEANLRRAEENFQRARDTVDTYLTKVSDDQLLNRPGMQPLRKELLELALKYYQEFTEQEADVPELQLELARAFNRVGDITRQIGAGGEARPAYEAAVAILERIVAAHPEVAIHQAELAMSYRRMAIVLGETGLHDEALSLYRKAMLIGERVAEENPEVLRYQVDLGKMYAGLPVLLEPTCQNAEALAASRRAMSIREKLAKENPENPLFQSDWASACMSAAIYQERAGQSSGVLELFEQAVGIWENLVESSTDVLDFQSSLANGYTNLAGIRSAMGQADEARDWYDKSIVLWEKLAEENPGVTAYRSALFEIRRRSGFFLRDVRSDATLALLLNSIADAEKFAKRYPDDVENQRILARSHSVLSAVRQVRGENDLALESMQKTISVKERLVERKLAVPQDHVDLARTYIVLAYRQWHDRGRFDEAVETFEKAVHLIESLGERNTQNPDHLRLFAELYQDFAALRLQRRELPDAVELWDKAIVIQQNLADRHPEFGEYQWQLAVSHSNLAVCERNMGRIEEALHRTRKAIALLESLGDESYMKAITSNDFNPRRVLTANYLRLSELLPPGERESAHELWHRCIVRVHSVPETERGTMEWYALAESLLQLGRFADARAVLGRRMKLTPGGDVGLGWWQLATAQFHLGEVDRARKLYDQMAALLAQQPNPDVENEMRRQALAKLLGIEDTDDSNSPPASGTEPPSPPRPPAAPDR